MDQFEPIEQLEMKQQDSDIDNFHDDTNEIEIQPILRRSTRTIRAPATYTDLGDGKVGASVTKDHYTREEQPDHTCEVNMEHKYDIDDDDHKTSTDTPSPTPTSSNMYMNTTCKLEEGEVPQHVVNTLTKHVHWADEDGIHIIG